MKIYPHRVIKACMLALLAAMGFSACSKPDDDPFNDRNNRPRSGDIICYYGVMPVVYQESLNTESVVSDLPETTPSIEPVNSN